MMHQEYLNIIREEIRAETMKPNGSNEAVERARSFHVDNLIGCIVLGDTKGLAIRLKRIREKEGLILSEEDQKIVAAAEHVLTSWVRFEQVPGPGSLLNYEYMLRHSPPEVVGVKEIEKARAFQASLKRDLSDPFWALQFCQ